MAETNSKTKTKAKKVYNIVSTIIVAIVFVFLIAIVAMVLAQRQSGHDSKIFGYYMYDVVTDSMTPTIPTGSVILSKAVKDPDKELKVGDIITFTAPSGSLAGYNETHRIVHIAYNDDGTIAYIITEGDKYNPDYNQNATSHKPDEWQLDPSAVKSKFVKRAVFVGGLRDFLSHWYGYVVLIVIPMCFVMALFIIGYVKDRVAYLKEKDAEKGSAQPAASKLDVLSDDDKKRLLEEYLKSQATNKNNDESKPQQSDNGEQK